MIAETIPGLYDFEGKQVFGPSKRRHRYFNGRPIGTFFSQPVEVECRDLEQVRQFLRTCRYVSDQEQFGVQDHWMKPHEFEQSRCGDCDDFALWTWRQLVQLGYEARFVIGGVTRYGACHAWVAYRADGKTFVLESTYPSRRSIPRLETLLYSPEISVSYENGAVKYYQHSARKASPTALQVAPMVPEWMWFRMVLLSRWTLWPYYAVRRILGRRLRRRGVR